MTEQNANPFPDLLPFSYHFIMADPPWHFKNFSAKGEEKNAVSHYDCMDLEDIKALPVSHLAGTAWDFTFKTGGDWHKMTKHGKQHFGTGYILRSASKPFLIGTMGSPTTSRSCRGSIEGMIREHSRKPDEAYAMAEKLMPHARRLDLFSRQSRPDWDSWGNETDRFTTESSGA